MTVAIYSVVRFRAKPGDMRDGAPIHGNTRLEVIWVTIPFIMVTALAIYGWITLDDLEAKQKNEMVVHVTGQQFTWTFEYPSEKVTSNELVLPDNRPVEFSINTKDVLHSFWVPQFRLKSDAVPGLTTKIRLTPNKVGRLRGRLRRAVRHRPLDDAPVRARRAAGRVRRLAARDRRRPRRSGRRRGRRRSGGGGGGGGADGAQVFASNGCASCHTLSVAKATGTVGPDLDNVDRPTAAFIRQSITDPNKVVTKGFQPDIMPQDFGDKLSPDELDALVEYLLKAQK